MLTDAHIHFIPQELSAYSTFYKGIWTDKKALYDFLEMHKIEKALVVYPSTDAHRKLGGYREVSKIYNDALEKIMKENKRIIASCILDLDNSADISSQIEDLNTRGFRVISLASSYEGKFIIDKLKIILEKAKIYNFLIFIHPQTLSPIGFERIKDPLLTPVLEYSFDISMLLGLLMMQGLLERFNIKFIFSSLAGIIPFLKDRFDRVYMMLRRREMVKDLGKLPSQILKNIYVDTSGSSLKNIQLALDLFGEDKILWGSDYPVNADITANLEALDVLGQEIKEKLSYKNFLNLFANE